MAWILDGRSGVNPSSPDRLCCLFLSLLAPLAHGCAPPPEDSEEVLVSTDICGQGFVHLLGAVEPEELVDYLEYRVAEREGVDVEQLWDVTVVESRGTRCGGANDQALCAAAFEGLPLESDFDGGFDFPGEASLVYTRGNEAGAITEESALRAFLGTVDAPGDAALLATWGSDHRLDCDARTQVDTGVDGYIVHTLTGGGCGPEEDLSKHLVRVSSDGTIEVVQSEVLSPADPSCSSGRLPPGLCRRAGGRGRNPVGDFLADVAHLEAAAVFAFRQLAEELNAHRAPSMMIRAARRSQVDEIRHARVMARLARLHRGQPTAPRVVRHPPRSLFSVSADNALEGCTRETYGALVAHLQARRAADPRVRRELSRIAQDETRHAALSWGLDAWVQARMTTPQRRRLARVRAQAWDRLENELTAEYDPRVHRETGMPEPDEARALFRALRAALV